MRVSATLLCVFLSGIGTLAAAQAPRSRFPVPDNPPPSKSQAPGPYAVTTEADAALRTHTLYRPTDLSPFKGKRRLPIVAWGNGGCGNRGRAYEVFLGHIASYGYLVIAGGLIDAPVMPVDGPEIPAADGAAPMRTKEASLREAIDWAIAENARSDSQYEGRLNPEAVAVMGTSCGGMQAIANSPDPRVKTTVAWNSGTPPAGRDPARASLSSANHETLKKLHAPIAYISGGPVDIAQGNAENDFTLIEHVPLFFGWIDVGHSGTFREPGGGRYGEVAVAWLDWQLKGDRKAARLFVGKDCGLCQDPVWHVKKKNIR